MPADDDVDAGHVLGDQLVTVLFIPIRLVPDVGKTNQEVRVLVGQKLRNQGLGCIQGWIERQSRDVGRQFVAVDARVGQAKDGHF